MNRLATILTWCSRASSVTAGLLLIFLAGVLVVDVVGRNLLDAPLAGAVAIVETSLVGTVFLGLAWAQRTGTHVAFPLLTDRIPSPATHWLQAGALCLVTVPVAAIGYRSVSLAIESFRRRETAIGIVDVPVWPARALIVVGLFLLVLELVRSAVLQLRSARRDVGGTR